MYECHLWMCLEDDTYESDLDVIEAAVARLEVLISSEDPDGRFFTVDRQNLQVFLRAVGVTNHRSGIGPGLDRVVETAARLLPGSYGLVYERDDEDPRAVGLPWSFRVRVIARGQVREAEDPFLSPIIPTIEDPEPEAD